MEVMMIRWDAFGRSVSPEFPVLSFAASMLGKSSKKYPPKWWVLMLINPHGTIPKKTPTKTNPPRIQGGKFCSTFSVVGGSRLAQKIPEKTWSMGNSVMGVKNHEEKTG